MNFLVVYELPLCGSLLRAHDDEQDLSGGLFLKLLEYDLVKDPRLNEITKSIPQNSKYTSRNIQNEVIDTFANLLTEIKKKYNNAGFSIKFDGSRDRCNMEILSVIFLI